jgi:hypothetical protein
MKRTAIGNTPDGKAGDAEIGLDPIDSHVPPPV